MPCDERVHLLSADRIQGGERLSTRIRAAKRKEKDEVFGGKRHDGWIIRFDPSELIT